MVLHRAYDNVAHYRNRCDAMDVHPAQLRELQDLSRFRFTSGRGATLLPPNLWTSAAVRIHHQLTRATASLTHLLLIRLSHGDPEIDRIGQVFAPQIRLIKGQALANLSAS